MQQLIVTPQLPPQAIESRVCEKQQPFVPNQTQSSQTQAHRLPDSAYNLESIPNDFTSNVEKQVTPDRSVSLEQTSKRPTRYNAQTVQIALKSPSKSPGKSPRQMEIVRQKSESTRGRSRGARNSSVGRGAAAAANRMPVSSRGRGRNRAPLVVPIGKSCRIIHRFVENGINIMKNNLYSFGFLSQQYQTHYSI